MPVLDGQPCPVSREQLLGILALACMAPSAANGQPWRFAWDGSTLDVFFTRSRTPGAVDAGGRTTWMLVGTFLECLDVAAARDGLATTCHLASALSEVDPVARVSFSRGGGANADLASTLAQRHTDRRRYRRGAGNHPALADIARDHEGSAARCRVIASGQCPPELLDYVGRCERLMWTWPRFKSDAAAWWRWSKADRDRTLDGVHWSALDISFLSSRILKAVASSPHDRLVQRSGFARLVEQSARRRLGGSGLWLSSVKSTSVGDLIAASRLLMRGWLRLQRGGLAIQPMSISTLFIYLDACQCMPEDMPPPFRELFRTGSRIVRESFACAADEIPLNLSRFGVPPGPLPREKWTRRLPVEDLVRFTA